VHASACPKVLSAYTIHARITDLIVLQISRRNAQKTYLPNSSTLRPIELCTEALSATTAPLCITRFRSNDSLTTIIAKYQVTFQCTKVLSRTAQDHEGPIAHNVVSIALHAACTEVLCVYLSHKARFFKVSIILHTPVERTREENSSGGVKITSQLACPLFRR